MHLNAEYENVSSESVTSDCHPCNPCTPDEVGEDGSQCYPCNPCTPDQLGKNGSQCYPCNPCSPDERESDGSQCYPCNPCSPDERGSRGSQCYPCNPCSPDEGESYTSSSNSDDSSCFITSACVETMNLPDNCDELQTLRVLRDKRKIYDSQFCAMVEEYYQIAPQIVSAINRAPDRKKRYADIYENMVKPCVAMAKQNRENDAVRLYTDIVLKLKERYLKTV